MSSLGINNLIIANNDFSEENIANEFSFIKKHRFRRVTFLLDFDVASDRLSKHLEYKSYLKDLIRRYKPYGTFATVETNVIFTKDAAYYDKLSKLAIKNINHIFITMLPFDGEDWYDYSMGYLLNHQRLTPCFVSFERALLSSNDSFANYLASTDPACFAIDINSFMNPSMDRYISKMISSKRIFVPTISGVIDDYNALFESLEHFKSVIGDINYTKLLLSFSKSNKLFLQKR